MLHLKNQKSKLLLLGLLVTALSFGGYFYYTSSANLAEAHRAPLADPDYLQAIELGGEWFLNNENSSFIYYEYYPYEDRRSSKNQRLRELGALWSITKLNKFLDDDRYEVLAQKGFKFFEDTFVYDEEQDHIYIGITPGKFKLGYNAFAILALLEIEHPKKDEYLRKLAKGILNLQQESGEIKTFFNSNRNTGVDYYPGEALLSLMALYEYTNDETYLNAVQKAFPFYVDYFKSNPTTAFPPWQSRAYYKYYQVTGDQKVADFIFEMSDFMLAQYRPANGCNEFNFSMGSVAAVHAEGVNMAYDIARSQGKTDKAECYKNFSHEAANFMISLQITDTQKFKAPAIGGIMGSLTSENQRVDRNQHTVLMLMDAYDFGIIK